LLLLVEGRLKISMREPSFARLCDEGSDEA
jgi:hypothetical protein